MEVINTVVQLDFCSCILLKTSSVTGSFEILVIQIWIVGNQLWVREQKWLFVMLPLNLGLIEMLGSLWKQILLLAKME